MTMKTIGKWAALAVVLAVVCAFKADHVTTIFVIGDSTAANKDLSKGSPERGWAMVLQSYFDSTFVRVDNHAVNGRSSKSFINEKRWDKVLSLIKPGDYVIIQFGHNDEKPKADRHTDPGSTFDYNLAKFVRETREKGGIPVLMNSVVRRNWQPATQDEPSDAKKSKNNKKNKKQTETKYVLTDTHGLYIVAPRDVAQRMNVHFVDANRITHQMEDSLGVEGSKKLHMNFEPGEHPLFPNGKEDNTHYTEYGANMVASRLADALCKEIPLLSRYRTAKGH